MRELIDPKTLPVGKQFMRRLIRDGVWILNGFSQDMAAPHPHVVIGKDMAAIIDTTDLDLDLREYVQQHVTDLPLAVLSPIPMLIILRITSSLKIAPST